MDKLRYLALFFLMARQYPLASRDWRLADFLVFTNSLSPDGHLALSGLADGRTPTSDWRHRRLLLLSTVTYIVVK